MIQMLPWLSTLREARDEQSKDAVGSMHIFNENFCATFEGKGRNAFHRSPYSDHICQRFVNARVDVTWYRFKTLAMLLQSINVTLRMQQPRAQREPLSLLLSP
jgi:hypothetical protein